MSNRLQEIQQRQEDETLRAWQDDRFNPLNERYLPANQQREPDTNFRDPRFSQPPEGAGSLRDAITEFANTDEDAQRLLARAGVQDQSAASIFRTRTCLGAWEGTMQFDQANSRYVFVLQREDGERRILYIDDRIDNRDAAIVEAMTQLKEADDTAHIHILGPNEFLMVQRLAARSTEEAIAQGLAYLFGADHSDEPGFNPYEYITREENQKALEQLMWAVFTGSPVCDRLGAEDLEAFKQYAISYIGNRAWNLSLLKSALDDYKNHKVNENLITLDKKMRQPEPPPDYDAMSEEEIEKLRDSVSREYARMLREQHRR